MALALAAFVFGVWLVQQLEQLPGWPLLAGIGGAGVALCGFASLPGLLPTARAGQRPLRLLRLVRRLHLLRLVRLLHQVRSLRLLRLALVLLAAALAGFTYAAACARLRSADELAFADEGRDLRLRGVVATLPMAVERGTRFVFAVEQVLAPAAVGHIPRQLSIAWYDEQAHPRAAERWEFTVRLRRPQGTFNPGGFDLEGYLFEQDVRASGYVRDGPADEPPRRLDDWVPDTNALIDRARGALRERLQQALEGQRYGGVIVALVMGDQGAIRQEDWTLFNGTGISHLVSISGLHITMIAALTALAAGAWWRRSPRRLALATVPLVRAVAGTLGALAYCLLAGWGVPAQRTFLMLSTVAAAQAWRIRPGAPVVLAVAAALVCVWDPWAVLAAGFWLSFGAVACIFLAVAGRRPPAPGWREALREGVRLQAGISVGQIPLTLAIFGQVSVVAPLANALAIPLVSYAVTPLALVGAALAALGGPLATPAGWLLGLSATLFGWLAAWLAWLARLPLAWFALPAPPGWTILLALAGTAWLLAPPGWPWRALGLAWMLPMLCWPAAGPGEGELWVTALDVGQGMGMVLETAGHTLVFDTGPRYNDEADAGSRVIEPYLRWRGRRRIDLLVVSHLDSDHSGGAASLLRAFPVERVLSSVEAGDRSLAGARGVQRCEAGQSLALGALTLHVLGPPAALYAMPHASTNAHSCVLLAQLGPTRVLLTGDVPARQEGEMARHWGTELQAGLLVSPHHGSRSSSSPALLDAVQPRWVAIQVGYRSRYGHPHPLVLARYAEHGYAVLRTDHDGAVQWRFDRSGAATLERWRRQHARYWHNQPAAAGADGVSHGGRVAEGTSRPAADPCEAAGAC